MSLRDTAPAQSQEPVDESYKNIIPGNGVDIPDLPSGALEGPRLYFRWSDTSEASIRHGMKFWLNTGVARTDGTLIKIPFVSAHPFSDFLLTGRRGTYVSRSAADKGCMLSKLADQRHPVIALNTLRKDKDGNYQPDVSPFHTIHAQVVRVVRDAMGKIVTDPKTGRPKVEVLPEAKGFEFRQAWWDQFVNLIEPAPVTAAAAENDGMTDAAPTAPPKDLKAFMAANGITDLSRIIFYIQKVKRTKNPTGDPKKDVDYVVSFSDKNWIVDADVVAPVDVLDWAKVYKSPTQEELNNLMTKAENRERSAGGAAVAAPAPQAPSALAGGAAPAAPAAAPSPDSPAAYLPTNQVPLDGAAPVPAAAAPAATASAPVAAGGPAGNPDGKEPF